MSDVAGRLSEGADAVIDTATYVAACAAVGRHHPGLTPEVIGQAYFAEAGLRLSALDADVPTLVFAAAAAEDALAAERQALEILAQGWVGESGSAAADFVSRQCAEAAAVITALRDATEVLIRLRQVLALQVDEKVATTVRVGDRADRAAWLTAAEGVLRGGAGDPAAAVVTGQVARYVAADIGTEWLPAMLSGSEAVSAAYRRAAADLAELPTPTFEIATAPAVAVPAADRRPATPPPGPGPGPVAPPIPAAAGAAPPSPPTTPGTLPTAVAADPIGITAPTTSADPPAAVGAVRRNVRRRPPPTQPDGPPADGSSDGESPDPASEPETPSDNDTDPEDGGGPANLGGAAPVQAAAPATPPEPAPPAVPAPLPPSTPPLPPLLAAEVPAPERTPCEIAADELPQVGQ